MNLHLFLLYDWHDVSQKIFKWPRDINVDNSTSCDFLYTYANLNGNIKFLRYRLFVHNYSEHNYTKYLSIILSLILMPHSALLLTEIILLPFKQFASHHTLHKRYVKMSLCHFQSITTFLLRIVLLFYNVSFVPTICFLCRTIGREVITAYFLPN